MIDIHLKKVNDLITSGNLPDAINYLGDLLKNDLSSEEKADIFLLLGEIFMQIQRFESAANSFKAALKNHLEANITNETDHRFYEALIRFNLSLALSSDNNEDEAIDQLKSALLNLEKISDKDELITEQKALVLHQLAVLFDEKQDNYLTRKYAREAQEQYLLLSDRERFAKSLSDCYTLVANAFDRDSDLHSATVEFKKAAAVYENMENSDRFLPYLAAIYNNIAVAHKRNELIGKAAEFYQKTLDIYRKLAKQDSEEYLPYLAATLNSVGIMFTENKYRQKALKFYQDALGIYEKLASEHPEKYTHYVATTIHNTGVLYDEMGDSEQALDHYQKALEMRRNLAEKEPVAFNLDTCVTLLNIVTLYHGMLEKNKDLSYREPALELLREAEKRLMLSESEKPVIKSMKSDVEYFREFFEEIDLGKLNG